ncbi:MAG: sensor histidine kinase [Sphaerochaetaceae bacterium]|nr:sensor histidine kinase [Sphaerochaetaceae bacterium]
MRRNTAAVSRSLKNSSLFTRLFLSFFFVMLIPLFFLAVAHIALGNNALHNTLVQQSENNIDIAGERMQHLIDDYRHKAYQISTDDQIRSVVRHQKVSGGEIFERLFSIMSGDTYLATASVVSKDGKVRLSTHLFPEQYDIRYHSNETTPFFEVNRLDEKNSTIITSEYRYLTQTASLVILNILRAIRDDQMQISGYVALDIHQEAFEEITRGLGFSDMLLIDSSNYRATSLVHVDKNGDFSLFPSLETVTFPLTARSYFTSNHIISLFKISNTSLYIAGITETSRYKDAMSQYGLILFAVILIGALIALSVALIISQFIGRPVNRLVERMGKVENGDLTPYRSTSPIKEFHQLEHSFNSMMKQINSLLELTREEADRVREAERKALEAQMNPHFLYNTLNTITSLAKINGQEQIQLISVKLGKLLRNAIDNREAEVTLKESFSLIESYMTIQHIRYGDKLNCTLHLDPSIEEMKTPKLIIQPLVENSIVHGLEMKMGEWLIEVTAQRIGGDIHIVVKDNGIGFDVHKIKPDSSSHVGIGNVRSRLALRYKDRSHLKIESEPGKGTTVTIIIKEQKEGDLP